MSVLFVSDLHLGHKAVLEHAREMAHLGAFRGGSTVEEHDAWVIRQMLGAQPSKRTLWWILGDVAMDIDRLALLDQVPGRKRLLLGNHDLFNTAEYLKHFEWVGGTIKKYGMWLSHVPMHPIELRGLPNIHGHCHRHSIREDPRYLNAAFEFLPKQLPLTLEQIRERFKDQFPAARAASQVDIVGDHLSQDDDNE